MRNILTVLLLLVFVGSVGIWVRSYFVGETIWRSSNRASNQGAVLTGKLACSIAWGRGSASIVLFRDVNPAITRGPAAWHHQQRKPTALGQVPRSPDNRWNIHFGELQLRYEVGPDPP